MKSVSEQSKRATPSRSISLPVLRVSSSSEGVEKPRPTRQPASRASSRRGVIKTISNSMLARPLASTEAQGSRGLRRAFALVPVLLLCGYTLLNVVTQSDYRLLISNVPLEERSPPPYSNTLDIISVGSLLKESFQDAQARTFGNHSMVRSFYRITESNDTDTSCFQDLATDQIDGIIKFCSVSDGLSFENKLFRNILFEPRKHAGWICAQKRPIDGLYNVLQKYKHEHITIPDYLLLIDDDTYLSIDSVSALLRDEYPPEAHNALAGCNFKFLNRRASFTFPYGGFGSFFSLATVQRLMQPIDCNDVDNDGVIKDPFARLACWRLDRNAIGEKPFFENGMSVVDLMYQFAAQQRFGDVEMWKSGFCFHSDHVLAYFINFYHIALPDNELQSKGLTANDEYRKKYKYQSLTKEHGRGREGECSNERDRCRHDSHVCHYVNPTQMENLWKEHLETQASAAKVVAEVLVGNTEKIGIKVDDSAVIHAEHAAFTHGMT